MSATGGERTRGAAAAAAALRLVPADDERPVARARPLRIVDVVRGAPSGALRAYLAAKAAYAARTGAFECLREGAPRPDVTLLHQPGQPIVVMHGGTPAATLPRRLGVDAAFYPDGPERRAAHVLCVGDPVPGLLEAAARADEPWPLLVMGAGAIHAEVQRLGLTGRVRTLPYERDREALAAAYRSARCVVAAGPLAALEAAASGAPTVVRAGSPAARRLGALAQTFDPGDLLLAVERARTARPNRLLAARFAAANRWERAFSAELEDLEALIATHAGAPPRPAALGGAR